MFGMRMNICMDDGSSGFVIGHLGWFTFWKRYQNGEEKRHTAVHAKLLPTTRLEPRYVDFIAWHNPLEGFRASNHIPRDFMVRIVMASLLGTRVRQELLAKKLGKFESYSEMMKTLATMYGRKTDFSVATAGIHTFARGRRETMASVIARFEVLEKRQIKGWQFLKIMQDTNPTIAYATRDQAGKRIKLWEAIEEKARQRTMDWLIQYEMPQVHDLNHQEMRQVLHHVAKSESKALTKAAEANANGTADRGRERRNKHPREKVIADGRSSLDVARDLARKLAQPRVTQPTSTTSSTVNFGMANFQQMTN